MRPAASVMTEKQALMIAYLASVDTAASLAKRAKVQQGLSFDPRYGVANKAAFIANATMYDAAARMAAQ